MGPMGENRQRTSSGFQWMRGVTDVGGAPASSTGAAGWKTGGGTAACLHGAEGRRTEEEEQHGYMEQRGEEQKEEEQKVNREPGGEERRRNRSTCTCSRAGEKAGGTAISLHGAEGTTAQEVV